MPPSPKRKDVSAEDTEQEYENRDYQNEMAHTAVEQNTIIYLPTGAGKTYISVMVIKRFHADIETPWLAGGKRVIFTAPKVALVDQQAEVLRKSLPFTVGNYNGYMQPEFWDKKRWSLELSEHQVLVMGSQILLDALDKGFISMQRIALLIFDECHHATGKHPMNQTMKMHYNSFGPMPRILGLTATLIKKNIDVSILEKEVRTLETNLCSKLIKLHCLDYIKGMYADPNIELVECPPNNQSGVFNAVSTILKCLINDMKIETHTARVNDVKKLKMQGLAVGHVISNPDEHCKAIMRQLMDIFIEIDNFGIFGGNFAIQCHRNKLQSLANLTDHDDRKRLFTMVVSQLEVARHLVESTMKKQSEDVVEQLRMFSSPKLLKCLEKLKDEIKSGKPLRCIIFVEKRMTAKILFTIIKILSMKHKDFKDVKPDFAVGTAESGYNTRIMLLAEKQTKRCVAKFAAGETNLVVSSSVMEEGIDVPSCNLVIKFDQIKTFCSFVQSKGRAREQDAKYMILQVLKSGAPGYKENRSKYNQLEHDMQKLHLHDEIDEKEEPGLRQYTTPAGAIATSANSVNILYKYCHSLGGDRFSTPSPTWFCKTVSSEQKFVSVLLPLCSTIADPISGPVCSNLKNAKSECALDAIKLLHQKGQLDDHLKCVLRSKEDLTLDSNLFPNWKEEGQVAQGVSATGTKGKRRQYRIKAPSAMTASAPRAGKMMYIHVISITPNYHVDDREQRKQTFLELLSSTHENFAIITSKPWPNLCQFPVFTNAGELKVAIKVNFSSTTVQSEDLKKLRSFHSFLFARLLALDKGFLAWNFESGKNDFLVAPVTNDGRLCWDLLSKNFDGKYDKEVITEYDSLCMKVIMPTYRTKIVGNYIVTEVQSNESPMSEFPKEGFGSYGDYFKDKWNVQIKDNYQPLVSVKQITENINFLNPRPKVIIVTRKAMHETDDFAEVFIPELCHLSGFNHLVSAEMWLKATFLPSILQRVTVLLHAEDLRVSICNDCKLGSVEVPAWKDFVALLQAPVPETKPKTIGFGLPKFTCRVPKVNETYIPWGEEDVLDPDYFLFEGVTWGQLEEYTKFSSAPLATAFDPKVKQKATWSKQRDFQIVVEPIKMFTPDKKILKTGPPLSTLYAAISTMSANDSVNMERLETLGDSYLKFITSVYLFCTSDTTEGMLTSAKGKLVGNRNLYYCAVKKGIPNILNHRAFAPKSDWKVPNFSVPQMLQEVILRSEVNPGVLNDVTLNKEEKATGNLIDVESIEDVFLKYVEDKNMQTTMTSFLDLVEVPDKNVADCVEAVIGAYVESCGPVLSASIISWFQILPDSIKTIITSPPAKNIKSLAAQNVSQKVESHLCGVQTLEAVLGYKFKNRSILLEALTHPSYIANRLTDSNQRLEFLGDAVLDFLITAHIYEKYTNLSPGDVTDLRSALVNNVTFASLAVRYGFHTYLLYSSPSIMTVIDSFVDFQQKNNHSISEEYLMLLQEDTLNIGHAVDVPKLLGDIFESIAGAVFLDSGKNLATTWEVFYPLMKKEIDMFGANVPINPVRKLYESVDKHDLEIGKPVTDDGFDGVVIKIVIRKDGKTYSCFGNGVNKHHAKKAAAKGALRLLMEK